MTKNEEVMYIPMTKEFVVYKITNDINNFHRMDEDGIIFFYELKDYFVPKLNKRLNFSIEIHIDTGDMFLISFDEENDLEVYKEFSIKEFEYVFENLKDRIGMVLT
jgi:hypothetical protein